MSGSVRNGSRISVNVESGRPWYPADDNRYGPEDVGPLQRQVSAATQRLSDRLDALAVLAGPALAGMIREGLNEIVDAAHNLEVATSSLFREVDQTAGAFRHVDEQLQELRALLNVAELQEDVDKANRYRPGNDPLPDVTVVDAFRQRTLEEDQRLQGAEHNHDQALGQAAATQAYWTGWAGRLAARGKIRRVDLSNAVRRSPGGAS